MAKTKLAPRPTKTRQRSSRKGSTPWYKTSSATSALVLAGIVAAIAILLVFTGRSSSSKPSSQYVKRDKAPVVPAKAHRLWKRTAVGPHKGVIATENISAGTLIILDTPFVSIPKTDNATLAGQSLLEAVDRLSKTAKEDFFNLPVTDFDLKTNDDAALFAANIFEANALTYGNTNAVYKNACYVKHSCNPNVDFLFRDDLNALVVHAVKDIPKGSEIFAPYWDSSPMTRAERQAHHHDTRGTPCTCSQCALTGDALKESDTRRNKIAQLRQLIYAWAEDSAVYWKSVLDGIEQVYELLEAEDYKADLGWWAGNGFQVAAAHESEEDATKWALEAAQYYAVAGGADAPQVKAFLAVAQNPQASRVWGLRVPKPEDEVDEEDIDFEALNEADGFDIIPEGDEETVTDSAPAPAAEEAVAED
ncbi:SET domain-containing protein [Clavulina sp. PMI_390]|nr:SET domain-containing protein [Clavulina sp. PMI_390]